MESFEQGQREPSDGLKRTKTQNRKRWYFLESSYSKELNSDEGGKKGRVGGCDDMGCTEGKMLAEKLYSEYIDPRRDKEA